MDIAICKINHKEKTLEYAGAMRPLWFVRNNELTEIKADKIPIGTQQKDRDHIIEYNTKLFQLLEGDSFYIFTDGYADQFGGDNLKKFSTRQFKDLILANSNLDFESQGSNIRNAHINWKRHHEQIDDILVIGFSV